MTTYSESAKGVHITLARALQELTRHGVEESEVKEFHTFFWSNLSDHKRWIGIGPGKERTIDAGKVLAWLGY